MSTTHPTSTRPAALSPGALLMAAVVLISALAVAGALWHRDSGTSGSSSTASPESYTQHCLLKLIDEDVNKEAAARRCEYSPQTNDYTSFCLYTLIADGAYVSPQWAAHSCSVPGS